MTDETKELNNTPSENQETPKTQEAAIGNETVATPSEPDLSNREKFYDALEGEQKKVDLNESIRERVLEKNTPVKEKVEKPVEKQVEEIKEQPETDIDRLKSRVEKRIGREVAKRKSLEEELQETRQRLADLETKMQNQTIIGNKEDKIEKKDEDREPTMEEVATALQKARAEGNVAFEIQILDYLMDRKKNQAIKEQETKVQLEQKRQEEINAKFTQLVADYTVFDEKGEIVMDSPLNLNNKNSLLYKTALQLYKDPELNQQFYAGDQVEGFRRAVGDAFRELVEMGYEPMPKKAEKPKAEARSTKQLSSPDSEAPDEKPVSRNTTPQDEIAEEMSRRNRYQSERSRVGA